MGTATQAPRVELEAAHAAYRAALAHELEEHEKLQACIDRGDARGVRFDAYMLAAHKTTRALQALTVALGLEWIG
ncbi:MAG: hypothetical protein ACXWPI_19295 [Ktedonobacterales bacterium]